MQLSEHTKKILENFVTINSGIVIKKTPEGQTKILINTLERKGLIYAQAVVEEKFDRDIVLYDLGAFLSVLSSFENPDITLHDKFLTVKDRKAETTIVYADASVVVHPKNELKPEPADFEFDLPRETLSKALSMSQILALPELRVFSDNGTLYLEALDSKNPNSNKFKVEVGTCDAAAKHNAFFARENIAKMLPGDYRVGMTDKRATFKSTTEDTLLYLVALLIN